ncbi:hypothetical protein [Streptomyces sp. NPDC085529]|uniref:hypothetical protein n=1 Tax=Streptomyces sp. NPDC085529 TaxID=3365729 RepID=UPI0037D8676D
MSAEFNFRNELGALFRRVQEDSRLEVVNYQLGDPVSNPEMAVMEDRLGHEIPSSVKALYGSLGHATFQWRFSPALDEQTKGRVAEEFASAVSRGNLYSTAAAIRILPLGEVLFGEREELEDLKEVAGEGVFEFFGSSYAEGEFVNMLRPFDEVNEFFVMALVVRAEDPDWKLMLLQDYWADYESSRTVSLDDYLRFTVSTLGLVNARAELFGEYRGYRRESLSYSSEIASSKVPPMLRSLAAIL